MKSTITLDSTAQSLTESCPLSNLLQLLPRAPSPRIIQSSSSLMSPPSAFLGFSLTSRIVAFALSFAKLVSPKAIPVAKSITSTLSRKPLPMARNTTASSSISRPGPLALTTFAFALSKTHYLKTPHNPTNHTLTASSKSSMTTLGSGPSTLPLSKNTTPTIALNLKFNSKPRGTPPSTPFLALIYHPARTLYIVTLALYLSLKHTLLFF